MAWNNITSLNQRMPFLRDHEVATAKVRDAYRQQFQIGQRTLLDLLNTENELFESRRALTNAQYDLKLAQYRWLALSHALLPALSLQPARNEMPRKRQAGGVRRSDQAVQFDGSRRYPPGSRARAIQRRHAAADVGAGQRFRRRRRPARRKPGRDSGLGKGGHMATENNGFSQLDADFVRVLKT